MKTRLTNARIAFADVFEPNKKFGKYGVRALIEKGSDNELLVKDAVEKSGSELFGAKWGAIKKTLSSAGKLVLHDGEEKAEERSEYAGMVYLNAKSDVRPVAVGRDGAPITKDDNILYAGCRADLILDIFAYQHKEYGNFIIVKLLGLQFRADDTRLSAGASVTEDDFKPITAGADAEDL